MRALRPTRRLTRSDLSPGALGQLAQVAAGISWELGACRGWAGEETLDAIRDRLSARPGLLYRTTEHVGQEGAFVACSFWLVEALARLRRG